MAETRDRTDTLDATDASLIGSVLHNKYVVIRRLGEGGMGRVYYAELKEARARKFAIKLLRPELTSDAQFRRRFHDEAQHQAQLDHENIVEMTDYFEWRGDYYLVLDYVDGQTLGDMIDAQPGRGMPEKQALGIIVGVLSGLDHAHQKGIVHRDVKPSNVLVDARGRPRITDFGIAIDALELSRIKRGQVIGTPEYMSPEQLSGAEVDHRSDVYSAGVMLYQTLTGRLPFQGDSFESIRAQQMTSAVPSARSANPKVPKRLSEIVRRSMQRSPVDRFQGAQQFVVAIEAYRRRGAWKYVMVSACVLIAAGVYVAQATSVGMQVVREAIQTASHDYNLMCREQQYKVKNQKGKAISDATGQSDFSEAFASHVKQNERNIQRNAREYADAFDKLTRLNQWSVRHALKEDRGTAEFAIARNVVTADYQAYTEHGTTPTVDSMLPRCHELGYDWKDAQ